MTNHSENMKESILRLWLIPGIGPSAIRKIADTLENPSDFIDYPAGLPDSLAKMHQRIRSSGTKRKAPSLDDELESMRKLNVEYMTYWCPEFPHFLKQISNPPVILFYAGRKEILENFGVSFVGTRRCSEYGKRMTGRLIGDLAKSSCDITIISGLAEGIDTVAHKAALKVSLPTAAVMAGGLNHLYPPSNKKLAYEIVDNGGVLVSEMPTGSKPLAIHFPLRNRIISGLSRAICITEAPKKSGALITADFANLHNREVYALPGNVDSDRFSGCNRLIQKNKAKLLISAEDILDDFRSELEYSHPKLIEDEEISSTKVSPASELSQNEKNLLDLLALEEIHEDMLIVQSGLSPALLPNILTRMELKGLVKRLDGGYWTLGEG